MTAADVMVAGARDAASSGCGSKVPSSFVDQMMRHASCTCSAFTGYKRSWTGCQCPASMAAFSCAAASRLMMAAMTLNSGCPSLARCKGLSCAQIALVPVTSAAKRKLTGHCRLCHEADTARTVVCFAACSKMGDRAAEAFCVQFLPVPNGGPYPARPAVAQAAD